MTDWAIDVREVVKIYRGVRRAAVRAVDGMSFSVRRGQIFGLLGPNGAGKTTLLKILTTLTRPTAGQAEVLGHDVVAAPLEVRRRISVVLQESAVEMFLTVRDNLLTFEALPPELEGELARLHPLRLSVAQNTVEMTLKTEEAEVLALVSGLARRGHLLKVEVSGATLEDIFVELMKEKPALAD